MSTWSFHAPFRGLALAPALLAVPLVAPPSAVAADPPPVVSSVLTLEEAWRAARQDNPDLQGARWVVRRAEGASADAERRPNPSVEWVMENWGGSLGSDRTESTVALSQVLELGGDRRARRALAGAEVDAARSAFHSLAREVRGEVTEAFVTAWVAQERLWLLRESRQRAAELVGAADERLRAGAAPALEGVRARGQAARTEAEIARAEAASRVARRALALRWGAGEATFDSLALPTPDLAPPPLAESLDAALRRHPDLEGAETAVRRARAQAQAARAARVPDLEASVGWKRLQEARGDGLTAGVSAALPIWNARSGELAAAEAERARAEVGRTALEARLRVEAHRETDELVAAIEAYRRLAQVAAPAAQEALEHLGNAYRAGRSSYVDLIEGQRAALESRMALVEAAAELWRLRARIERLTGSPDLEGGITR